MRAKKKQIVRVKFSIEYKNQYKCFDPFFWIFFSVQLKVYKKTEN